VGLQVVGAGLGRTGTHSLKLALEQLLSGPCYHMIEVFEHPEHVPLWHAAVRGERFDWDGIFDGYVAAVDWPAAAFWREIAATNPDAPVLLSVRDDAEAWWRSAHATIFEAMDRPPPPEAGMDEWYAMVIDLLDRRFTPRWQEQGPATTAYDAHSATVRAEVPADRLVEWRPSDGWAPLCAALDLPMPDSPFPHVNTTAEFRQMANLDVHDA
jgi:hypothetical protein